MNIKRLATGLGAALLLAGVLTVVDPAPRAAHAVYVKCDQNRYIADKPYQDDQGWWWECRRNYQGRYVWYITAKWTGISSIDPLCDADHEGHIWEDYEGNFRVCERNETSATGWRWKLLPPGSDPFKKSGGGGAKIGKGSFTNSLGFQAVNGPQDGSYGWCNGDPGPYLSERGNTVSTLRIDVTPGECNGLVKKLPAGNYKVLKVNGYTSPGGVHVNCIGNESGVERLGTLYVDSSGYGSGNYTYISAPPRLGTNICVSNELDWLLKININIETY